MADAAGVDRTLAPGRVLALAALMSVAAFSCGGGGGTGRDAGAGDLASDKPIYRVVDAPALDGSVEIADTGVDQTGSAPGTVCNAQTDCSGLPAGAALPHCPGSFWSCLRPTRGMPGRCVRECMSPARTCEPGLTGCVECDVPSFRVTCPSTRCALSPGFVVEGTTCTTPPTFHLQGCRGDWLWRDGGLCAIQELPTGAIRFAIACPDCTTIVVQR